jgi:hypothetical protein
VAPVQAAGLAQLRPRRALKPLAIDRVPEAAKQRRAVALPGHGVRLRADAGISNLNPRSDAACTRRQTAAATMRSSSCSRSRRRFRSARVTAAPPRVVGEQIAIRASALLVTFPAQPFNLALEIVARSASLPSVEIEPRSPHGRADALGAVVQIGRQFGTERLVRNRARHPLEFRNGPAALSIGALLAGVRAMAARSPGRRLLDVVAALGADGGFRNGSAHAAAAFARRRSRC